MEGISPEAAAAFDRLEKLTGPLTVTSGYRSPEQNKKVGGAKGSQHLHGNAFDIDVSGMPREERVNLIQQAREAGFRGIGVYDNSLHFDVGPQRHWGPSYGRESTPEWAMAALGGSAGSTSPTETDRMNRLLTLASAMPKWRNSLRNT